MVVSNKAFVSLKVDFITYMLSKSVAAPREMRISRVLYRLYSSLEMQRGCRAI
jgi:hypothetical protein